MGLSVGVAMRNEADAPSVLSLALLSSELREQAGLLGSIYTPALARHRTLTQVEQFRIERVLGRIDELWTLINSRIATRPELATLPIYAQLQQRYFGEGLQYLDQVRQNATVPSQGLQVSTGELAAGGVPLAMALMMRVARPKGRITRRRNCTSTRASAATSKAVAANVSSSSREACAPWASMLWPMSSSRASRNWTMEPINGT